jgi:outer membrane protein TolC
MKSDLSKRTIRHDVHKIRILACLIGCLCGLWGLAGCKTPAQYRGQADEVAAEIITDKQEEALGDAEPFSIERPSDILRRRLLDEQELAYSSKASLGTDQLDPIPHWPDGEYPPECHSPDANVPIEPNVPVKLSLLNALQVAARNSPDYQSRKEDVFRAALDLDLERNEFRNIFRAQADSRLTSDTTGDDTVTTVDSGGFVDVTRRLKNGAELGAALAVDLANLLTQGGSQVLGISGDASVSMPLLRGAGRHIVTEPLTQAERNVVYEIWDFERFKRTFAVSVAQGYFGVLRQMDQVQNAEDNYESAVFSARSTRRRADAGRVPSQEVDQAVQRELTARNGWISAQEQLKNRLDIFKSTLGLPPDANIELDRSDLDQLRERAATILGEVIAEQKAQEAEAAAALEIAADEPTGPAAEPADANGLAAAEPKPIEPGVPADAPVELVPASYEDAGPYEIAEDLAVKLALENRLDLMVANGGVYDAQRRVVVRADALRAGLTLGGSVSTSDDDDDGEIRFDGARYAALLSVDLPIERTAERNAYRRSLIDLERATRSVQSLEDQIKLSIRSALRTLLNSRESVKIQAQSILVAEKRVRLSNLLLDAGRAQTRDLLEAQDALLAAQNDLTRQLVDYRIAELEIQRDVGLLKVNERGLWQEFSPEDMDHGNES